MASGIREKAKETRAYYRSVRKRGWAGWKDWVGRNQIISGIVVVLLAGLLTGLLKGSFDWTAAWGALIAFVVFAGGSLVIHLVRAPVVVHLEREPSQPTEQEAVTDLFADSLKAGRELAGFSSDQATWRRNTKALIRESIGRSEAELFETSPLDGGSLPLGEAYQFHAAYVTNLASLLDQLDSKSIRPGFRPDEWEVNQWGPKWLGGLTFREELEPVDWQTAVNGQVWTHEAVFWIWVRNDGPTSTFAAQIVDVHGLPIDWAAYHVAEPLWDGKAAPTVEIPSGHQRKLRIASVLREPRGFWFWTAEQRTEAAGWQLELKEAQPLTVDFRLEVTNTRSDRLSGAHATIKVSRATECEFELEQWS